MKIFSSEQIKQWDNYTIIHEPISPVDLMERAAGSCFQWIINNFTGKEYKIFCGKGNNGGDGLAIARMLLQNDCTVSVYILESGNPGSEDFQKNLSKLKTITDKIQFINSEDSFPEINSSEIVIDCLFGTGLNKPVSGIASLLIQHINNINTKVVSIDMPSGMFADKTSNGNIIIKTAYTLTFQQYKLAFLMPENAGYFGKIIVLDIGLLKDFINNESTSIELIDAEMIRTIYKPRNVFSNKGDFGFACLLAGSYGMMGAAVLAAKACLRSGVGKLTCYIPKKGYGILQTSVPEAMANICGENFIEHARDILKFNTIGIGPGIGSYPSHKKLLNKLFENYKKPIVLDADALNIISENNDLLKKIPGQSIITPHPKEFERLFGKTENNFERMELAVKKSNECNIFIVLKGHHTLIATPDKKIFFNSTGNAGMATAGSGDVLTGIITGLLAQGYSSLQTCILGVYLHGFSGDIAAQKNSEEAMTAGDIIRYLGQAFNQIKN